MKAMDLVHFWKADNIKYLNIFYNFYGVPPNNLPRATV